MSLVIDANCIIAALIRNSKSREIIISGKFDLVSPDYLLDEINKHLEYITKKSGVPLEELKLLLALLIRKIRIVPHGDYKAKTSLAQKIMRKDVKDVPYVACCLALNCDGIWTNDADFEGQEAVKLFSTEQLSHLL